MRKTVVRLAVIGGLLITVSFTVVLVNQTAQLVALAGQASPLLGEIVFWALVNLYLFCVLVPLYLLLRLPRPLKAPATENDPSFPEHLERLRRRLRSNPHLRNHQVESREDVDAALVDLDRIAEERIRKAASQVFVTTAISQNGSLDSILVLAAQSRLVLEVARTYYQRPTVRDLVYLYSNVSATVFVAGELEDLDVSEQLQPVIAAALGSAAGAIPGLGAVSSIFANSVMGGAANAFLTLRVGVITRQYCRAVVLPPRRAIRRAGVLEATQLLGAVAVEGTKRVAAAMGEAAKDTVVGSVGGAFQSVGGQIRTAGVDLRDRSASIIGRIKRQPATSPPPADPEPLP